MIMQVTDKMVDAARKVMGKTYADQDVKARDVIEAALQSAWISVEDRLPEPVYMDGIEQAMEYLVFDSLNKKVSHDYFHTSRLYDGLKGWNHYGHHVTHWTPLPEYKGE